MKLREYKVTPAVREDAPEGLAWLDLLIAQYEPTRLGAIHITPRSERDGYNGYGRIRNPKRGKRTGFTIEVGVGADWHEYPKPVTLHGPLVYYDGTPDDGSLSLTLPEGFKVNEHHEIQDRATDEIKRWATTMRFEALNDPNDVTVYHGSYAVYLWLRKTGQVPGRAHRSYASAFAWRQVLRYREGLAPIREYSLTPTKSQLKDLLSDFYRGNLNADHEE